MDGTMIYKNTRIEVTDVTEGYRLDRGGWWATSDADNPMLRCEMFYLARMFEFVPKAKASDALEEALDHAKALESRIAAALEIADGMSHADRHFGMTIEGRGEVIRAALSGTADHFGDAATVAPYPNSGTTSKEGDRG